MRYRAQAEIHLTAHRLRHSFANDLVAADAPVTSIQKLLGHRWLETTQIYVQANDQPSRPTTTPPACKIEAGASRKGALSHRTASTPCRALRPGPAICPRPRLPPNSPPPETHPVLAARERGAAGAFVEWLPAAAPANTSSAPSTFPWPGTSSGLASKPSPPTRPGDRSAARLGLRDRPKGSGQIGPRSAASPWTSSAASCCTTAAWWRSRSSPLTRAAHRRACRAGWWTELEPLPALQQRNWRPARWTRTSAASGVRTCGVWRFLCRAARRAGTGRRAPQTPVRLHRPPPRAGKAVRDRQRRSAHLPVLPASSCRSRATRPQGAPAHPGPQAARRLPRSLTDEQVQRLARRLRRPGRASHTPTSAAMPCSTGRPSTCSGSVGCARVRSRSCGWKTWTCPVEARACGTARG